MLGLAPMACPAVSGGRLRCSMPVPPALEPANRFSGETREEPLEHPAARLAAATTMTNVDAERRGDTAMGMKRIPVDRNGRVIRGRHALTKL